MKIANFKAKNIFKIFFVLFLFIGLSAFVTYYSLAYWSTFYVDKESVDFTLKTLEATSTDFQITAGPESSYIGTAPYKINAISRCENFDEETGDCIEPTTNLCPYIRVVPKDGETEDLGYGIERDRNSIIGVGGLNFINEDGVTPLDLSDNWTISVKSPCFEGECPADYDKYVNGDPLPLSLKGEIFKCDLEINSLETPPLCIIGSKLANASVSNKITVFATLLGGTAQTGNSNVVFIPGLQASRLYTKGLLSENQLWEPNRNQDVEWLYLDENGKSLYDVYTRDIIERTNVGAGVFDSDVYKSFVDMMDGLVLEKKINAWEALPYDWRMDLNKIVIEPVKLENGKTYNIIDEIIKTASSSQTGKVSIVTHSNGGLVAKTLINEFKKRGKESLIDELIMVASPELGTPTAVASLLHGDEQEILKGFLVKKSIARTLGENMMGAYNLLPSDEYFKKVASPVIEFDASVDKFKNYRTIYGDNIDSASELQDFLLGKDGRVEPADTDTTTPNVLKAPMLSLAKTNHDVIDNLAIPENIKVTELAGWGVSTIRGIKYIGKEVCVPDRTGCFKVNTFDREPLYTSDGDETVVAPSATVGSSTYYLDLKKFNFDAGREFIHKDIFETSPTLDFVKNILINSDIELSKYITKEKPITLDKKKELVLHSPVSIDVYDSEGRHTGLIKNPNPNSDLQAVEENIPGSRYMEFGEGKYVLLDEGTAYIVKLQGLDVGTFTFEANTLSSGGETLSSSEFVDIPTSPDMKGEIQFSTTSTGSSSVLIKIDVNGDGKNDFTINPNADFDPIVYLQILRKTVETFSASAKTKNEIYKKIDTTIKSLQKNKTKSAIIKIKQFSKDFAINQKHQTEEIDKKHKGDRDIKNDRKKKKLNITDSETMLQMLSRLLNNLI
jgi:hypothetical protein